MNNFDIAHKLNNAKFIFREPIMSGHYVWRSSGINFVNNIYKILYNEISLVRNTKTIQCGSIVKIDNYINLYKEVSDYKNVFASVNFNYAIRPENTSVLLKALHENKDVIVMINTPLYRQFQSKAFLVDQRIWPAPSFCLSVNKRLLIHTIDDIMSHLNLFFDKMLLPYLWIEQKKGFKNFAERMFLPLMPENSKVLTIASTLYVLSGVFSKKLSTDEKIIQYGFSERLIYLYCVMQENKPYVVWPSGVATFDILISEDIEEHMNSYIEKTRYKVFKLNKTINKNTRIEDQLPIKEGYPIILFRNNNEIFYKLAFTGEIGKLTSIEMIKDLLQKSDSAILINNQTYFNECLSEYKVEFLCEKCENSLEGFASLGNCYPEIFSNCKRCGMKNSLKKLFLPSNTRSSINEKLINKK
ncbi:MAG: hypothetical protein UR23_C0030G0003 [Candidatus Roizmanbacteria bacterium GW2011_GWA2_32_13]|uniref:Uncharacterized protein n=1 Tax=Candidatus Roizmanbacteria bacterium GW2011_GWA2_32_13 TaxID=1618475 RepID=A0A0G0BW09_9BACT|nr:MAG: hypothetical protein UR23_C0030G0003 [Candidatus Roizmanbacteria bacterium GW2011_GWA2_32_13]